MQKVIEVKNLSKVYALYEKPIDRLKEVIRIPRKSYHTDFYALSDINFDVCKGESVGIIGVNGSGKSTLLKIITGVLKESSGSVKVDGKVSALLELGAGFNMEYTGIENIYMNGTMMGFSKKEMDQKLQKILDFAELKNEFYTQPVKQYSSGMFVRLAFALSIAVDPDILIVDEALSVGDIFFQNKCYKRMDELKNKGTTILMVTHDLGAVIKYCDRTILLNSGKQVAIGTPHEMVDLYKKILSGNYNEESVDNDNKKEKTEESKTSTSDSKKLLKSFMNVNKNVETYGDNKIDFIDFGILDAKNNPATVLMKGEDFIIKEKVKILEDFKSPIFTWTIKSKRGDDLTGTNTMIEKIDVGDVKKGDVFDIEFKQKMRLQGGEYLLSMSCTSYVGENLEVHKRMYDIINITVLPNKNTVGIFDSDSDVKVNKE